MAVKFLWRCCGSLYKLWRDASNDVRSPYCVTNYSALSVDVATIPISGVGTEIRGRTVIELKSRMDCADIDAPACQTGASLKKVDAATKALWPNFLTFFEMKLTNPYIWHCLEARTLVGKVQVAFSDLLPLLRRSSSAPSVIPL